MFSVLKTLQKHVSPEQRSRQRCVTIHIHNVLIRFLLSHRLEERKKESEES
jgi:hypothetical protein